MSSPRDKQPNAPEPSDRRLRAMRQRRERRDHRIERTNNEGTRRRKKFTIVIGAVVLAVIGGLVGFGFYDAYIAPTKVLAARVGDKTYTQGDLVKRVRLMQSVAAATERPFELGRAPFEVLMDMAEAEVIRRGSPALGVHVSDADVEAQLNQRFRPNAPPGQEVPEGQLEREYQENYNSFLNLNHLSDNDFRQIVEEQIYRSLLRQKLGEQVPSNTEQVEVNWIKILSASDVPAGATPPNPNVIIERLEKEDFRIVAREFNADTIFSNRDGYVGWVPKGSFPDLDPIFFGDGESAPIPHDQISRPIFSSDNSIYILKVVEGPEVREVSALMREQMKNVALDLWLQQQQVIGTSEGWWEVKFNSDIYAWVIDQVRQAAPRITPSSGGQG